MHYGKTNGKDKFVLSVFGNEMTHEGNMGKFCQGFCHSARQWCVLFIKGEESGAFWGRVVNV